MSHQVPNYSGRTTIKLHPIKLTKSPTHQKYISLRNPKSNHWPNHKNPFDSMIYKVNSNPVLPPVLSKHKKTLSIPQKTYKDILKTDRPSVETNILSKSDINLQKKARVSREVIPKSIFSKIFNITPESPADSLQTPYFSKNPVKKLSADACSFLEMSFGEANPNNNAKLS